jgi:hypothetical protein
MHREMPGSYVLRQIQCAVMQGSVRLRNALKCIDMHLGTYVSLIDWISGTRSEPMFTVK